MRMTIAAQGLLIRWGKVVPHGRLACNGEADLWA
jgi:hypothetical protein